MVSIRPKVLAKKLQFKNTPLSAQITVLKLYELRAGHELPHEDQEWLRITIRNLEQEHQRRTKKKPAT
jgi:hypothetical protein